MKNEANGGVTPSAAGLAGEQGASSDPESWVDEHGDYLYSYAMLRLRDPAQAQDAVQETFLAALKSRAPFSGKSAQRGWLVGILKHKICDSFRQSAREPSFTTLRFFEDEEAEHFVSAGLHRGAWTDNLGPKDCSSHPGDSLDREEFWHTLRGCISKLPKKVSEVFLLREMDEHQTCEICDMLKISDANLWVMLHRARMALRRCLEKNWFAR